MLQRRDLWANDLTHAGDSAGGLHRTRTQCQRTGVCIAALAGCCRTVVKNALRQARLLGLLLVKERRIPGHLPPQWITAYEARWSPSDPSRAPLPLKRAGKGG